MPEKVVVVTGASGFLGRAISAAAISQGFKVAALDRAKASAETGTPPALTLGGIDLTDYSATEGAMNRVAVELGRIDGLVNVAGAFRWQTLAEGELANWDLLYTINLRTTVNASRAALPYLVQSGQGRIVNIGANAALKAGAGMGPYAASKAGVHRLTEALAEEVKGQVTVNALLPSIIDTPVNRADMPDADFTRWVQPAELAGIVLFLLSDAASAITGALIPVTGRV
jgi:NAD(P)-dependent dehydrogenase (short-subunit alcohol dehydrogenase family)